MAAISLNFALLDANRPEVARLIAAMLQARDAVEHRSWSHPQELTGEEWRADVLADPRARNRERRTDLAVKRAYYRLADEKREIILVACSKCDWRAAFSPRRSHRLARCRLRDAQLAQPSRRTELRQARLSLGSLRRALRRADRGRPTPRVGRDGGVRQELAAGVGRSVINA
jgi:hypothetical protein